MKQLTLLFAIVVAIHGPVDVLVTLVGWQFESNPVVIALGAEIWLLGKAVALLLAAAIYVDAQRPNPRPYQRLAAGWFGLLTGGGLALIAPNYVILLAGGGL